MADTMEHNNKQQCDELQKQNEAMADTMEYLREELKNYKQQCEKPNPDDIDNSKLEPNWRRAPPSKRTSPLISPRKCGCKGNCGTNMCSCQKRDDACTEYCKCESIKCENKLWKKVLLEKIPPA